MRIELFSRRGIFGKRHYFRIRADNGQVVAQSEAYNRYYDAVTTAHSLRANLGTAEIADA